MYKDRRECHIHCDHEYHCPDSCENRKCYDFHHGHVSHGKYHKPHNHCDDIYHHHHHHFKPIPGESKMETDARLYRAVNEMACEFEKAMCEAEGLIHKLERRSIYNGAYYDGVVTVEEGWSSEDSTAYKLTKIPHKDKGGCTIKMKLHLAYGNSTNSKVNEAISDAAQYELADKMYTAALGNRTGGWTGKVRYDFAPLPSDEEPNGFTMGFTSSMRMKWYRNTVSNEQLKRDCIENSMGVLGVLVNNKEVSEELFGLDVNDPVARVVIGQNYETKDIYVLTCGSYDRANNIENASQYGMKALTAANIMAGYCDIAVTVSADIPDLARLSTDEFGCSAVDKGSFMFLPKDAQMPKAYAYWYISRKSQYQNNYTFESATLRQLYGQLEWRLHLSEADIDRIIVNINKIESELDRIEAESKERDQELKENIDRVEEESIDRDNILQDNIDDEEAARIAADEILKGNIDQNEAESIARDDALQAAIEAEESARIDADNVLQGNITKVDTNSKNRDATLQQHIDDEEAARIAADDSEKTARIAADNALSDRLDLEQQERIAEDKELSDRITNLIANMETDLQDIEDKLAQEVEDRKNGDDAARLIANNALTTAQTVRTEFDDLKNLVTTNITDFNDRLGLIENRIQGMFDSIAQLQALMAELDTMYTNTIATINEFKETLLALETLVNSFDGRLVAAEENAESANNKAQNAIDLVSGMGTRLTAAENQAANAMFMAKEIEKFTLSNIYVTNRTAPFIINDSYITGGVDYNCIFAMNGSKYMNQVSLFVGLHINELWDEASRSYIVPKQFDRKRIKLVVNAVSSRLENPFKYFHRADVGVGFGTDGLNCYVTRNTSYLNQLCLEFRFPQIGNDGLIMRASKNSPTNSTDKLLCGITLTPYYTQHNPPVQDTPMLYPVNSITVDVATIDL